MGEFAHNISSILDQVIQSISVFRPELALTVAFLVTIVFSLFIDKYWKYASFVASTVGILLSFTCLFSQIDTPATGFFDMLVVDNFSVYARGIILIALLVVSIFIQQHFKNVPKSKNLGDIYSILLTAGLGLNIMTMTSNWLLIFIAIETVSISSYILVGYFSQNKQQAEASMKYVLFGSVSAAVMLYGLSLLYGFTGNLDFASQEHIQGLIQAPQIICTLALLFVFTGLGFKLGFVPFHLWTPDVYQGAPTPITAFLSTVPKIGAIVLFSRLFQAWQPGSFYFSEVTVFFICIVAIVTMLVGNLIALRQLNIKRMMAYSSIGHTGFLLMALLVTSHTNQEILLFYLTVYTIMNLAIFAFIDVLEQRIGSTELVAYAGLGKKYTLLFVCFTFVGIALVGLPPTAGFIGKLLVFTAVFEHFQNTQGTLLLILLIVGALTSVISLFYYFRIPLQAFLRKEKDLTATTAPSIGLSLTLCIGIVLSILVLVLGLFPQVLLELF